MNTLYTWLKRYWMRSEIKHYDFQGIPADIAEDIRLKLMEKGYELVSVTQDKSAGTMLWFKSNVDEWPTKVRDEYIRQLKERKPRVDANSYKTMF